MVSYSSFTAFSPSVIGLSRIIQAFFNLRLVQVSKCLPYLLMVRNTIELIDLSSLLIGWRRFVFLFVYSRASERLYHYFNKPGLTFS